MKSLQPEIKEGYKQTEIGIIPKGWDIGKLKRFWTVTDCKHITAKFIEDGIPIASIKEVQSRFVDLRNAKQTTPSYYAQLVEGGRKPQPGDLIFSRNATVGEVAQVAEWHPAFAMGQDVCLLRKTSSDFSSDYLQTVLQSPIISDQITNLMVGSTFKRVNVEQIKNLIVPMPRSEEQQAIAEALSDVDTLIASLDQLVIKKRNIKLGAMQLLLTGKRRLPGFSGKWKTKKLSEIAEVIMGQSPSSAFYNLKGKGLPLIQGNADIKNRKTVVRFYTTSITKKCLSGDIIMSVRAPVGETAKATFNACIGRGVCAIRYNNDFLFHYLVFFENSWLRLSTGSTFDSINSKEVNDFELEMPPTIEEQQAISQALSDMDAEIEALEKKRDKYKTIKQGMMQELLTGKTRLV